MPFDIPDCLAGLLPPAAFRRNTQRNMKIHTFAYLTLSVFAGASCAQAGWHFPVGFGYASGFSNVVDVMEDSFGYEFKWEFPLGPVFSPYYEFENGFGMGASLGPGLGFTVDEDGDDDADSLELIIPLGLDARYAYSFGGDHAVFARAGLRATAAFGDYLDSGDPGLYGGLGMEFYRSRVVGFGFEIGYDSSEIEISRGGQTFDVKPTEWMVSAFVLF